VLGTPLVTDIFHADRWDYVFFRELPNGKREQRNLSVVFQDSKLVRVIGDILPDPNAAAKPAAEPKPAPVAKPAAEPKPAAAEAKPAPEPAKAAPEQASERWEPTKQNWGSAPPEPEKPAAPQVQEEPKPAAEEEKERGFFGRLIDRLAPGSPAEAKTETPAEPVKPAAEVKVEEPKAAEGAKADEQKPPEEKKERGFFGRMLEKIGL
jgi:hypothetical protein